MFNLTSNEYVEKGICKYADDRGNTAFFRRDGPTKFTAKLRFADKRVTTVPIQIDAYTKENGVNIKVTYPMNSGINEADVNDRIGDFGKLINHWIELVQTTVFVGAEDSRIIKYGAGEITQDGLVNTKCDLLAQFEELAPLANVLTE